MPKKIMSKKITTTYFTSRRHTVDNVYFNLLWLMESCYSVTEIANDKFVWSGLRLCMKRSRK